MNNFNKFDIDEKLKENLKTLAYEKPTSIQEKAIPLALKQKDIIAQAKTGSGKTVAFSIPIVNSLDVKKFKIQSLILAPTRELANQVANEIKKLCRFIPNVKVLTLCGGVPYKPQAHSLRHSAHIIVGTPGRVLKHLEEKTLKLQNINSFVLDEADKMLDMGFFEDIMKVVSHLPKNRQNMLFSATYDENIKSLAKDILNDEIFVKDESVHNKEVIKQKFVKVTEDEKIQAIDKIIKETKAKSVLIFSNWKVKCDEIADEIFNLGYDCVVLNSDIEQKLRDETLVLFSNKSYPVMVATDVASRGLDIDDIDLVINYDLAKDEKVHIHRIGRTARAGAKGVAVSLYTYDDMEKIDELKDFFDDVEDICFDKLSTCEYKLDTIYRTIYINGGKKHKLRAGDIVGTLIAQLNLTKDDIGDINIFPTHTYVAVKKEFEKDVLKKLNNTKIKGKYYRVFKR